MQINEHLLLSVAHAKTHVDKNAEVSGTSDHCIF